MTARATRTTPAAKASPRRSGPGGKSQAQIDRAARAVESKILHQTNPTCAALLANYRLSKIPYRKVPSVEAPGGKAGRL